MFFAWAVIRPVVPVEPDDADAAAERPREH
jgi:hypothetical protein